MNGAMMADTLVPIDIGRSLTDTTYDRLVDAIATDRLPPGARLNQRDLADQLQVSRQPISHALLRLKASGLAVEVGRKGLIVAPIDRERLRDLYAVRMELEGLVAMRAAEAVRSGTALPAAIAALQAARDAGDSITATTPIADCIAADVAFHLALLHLSGSAVIAETIEPLWPHFRRSMGRALSVVEHRKLSWAGHDAIMRAVIAGDATCARGSTRAHISSASVGALCGL